VLADREQLLVELFAGFSGQGLGAQDQTIGGSHADCRGAPDAEGLDRLPDRINIMTGKVDDLVRQPGLIEQD
jgi:hypothetical protein